MKKAARRVIASILSVVIILTSVLACDFSAFAKTRIETTTAKFDFNRSFAAGYPPIDNTVGNGSVSFLQYRNNGYATYGGANEYHNRNNGTYSAYYTQPFSGCFEEDGMMFIDHLNDYIKAGSDFEISWRYYVYGKSLDLNEAGYFCLGTNYNASDKGNGTFNISENNVLSVNYQGKIRQGGNMLSPSFSSASEGVKDCKIYYSSQDRTFTITINGETKVVNTTYSPEQMRYFGIGSATNSSYGRFIIENLTIKTVEYKLDKEEIEADMRQAMSVYEEKMARGVAYKNMSAAYKAYVNCQKAYDAYFYGGETGLDMAGYADALRDAAANMTVWTSPKGNFVPAFSNSDSRNPNSAVNCLWAEYSDDPWAYKEIQKQNVTANFYYHNSVYMYDGEISIPFIVGFYRTNSIWSPRNPRVWYASLFSQEGGLRLKNDLYRGDIVSYRDFNTIYNSGYRIQAGENTGYSIVLSTGDIRYMANFFTVDDSAFAENQYYVQAYPTYFRLGYGDGGDSSSLGYYTVPLGSNKSFYIINYKELLDYINSGTHKEYFRNISEYSEGGLEKLMEAYDAATPVNPTLYDYSSNTASQVSGCANTIRTAVDKFKNVGAIKKDSSEYYWVRKAIDKSKEIGEVNPQISNGSTNTTRYTAQSWNAYADKLRIAKSAMANVVTSAGYASHYNNTQIINISTDFYNAVDNLKYNYIVEYISFAGEKLGAVVCGEGDTVRTDLVMNTAPEQSTDGSSLHKVYYWQEQIIDRATYADVEVVSVREQQASEECDMQQLSVVSEATCTAGEVSLCRCSVCGAEREITTSEPLGHNYVSEIVEPTCTQRGYTVERCTRCSNEIIDESSYTESLGHEYSYEVVSEANCVFSGYGKYSCIRCDESYTEEIPVNPNAHAELIYSRTVAPTETEQGYDIYYCSNLCGYWEKRNFTDPVGGESDFSDYLEAYNAAVAGLVTDFEPYTDESADLYRDAVAQAKMNGEAAINSQSAEELELATKALIESSALLRIKTCEVLVYINGADGEAFEIDSLPKNVNYGDELNINLASQIGENDVEKWTVEQNGVTKKVALNSQNYDIVVKDDAVVNVYLSENKTSDDKKYSKVTMLNNDGKVIGTEYVLNGFELDLSAKKLLGISAPDIPFYQFAGWEIVSGSKTVNGDTVIQANYAVI